MLAKFQSALAALPRAQWRLFVLTALVGLAGVWWLVYLVNQSLAVTVAAPGGSLTEGIVGSPRFINPLLANSDADRDLTTLIYSGLMRIGVEGSPIPDLAERVDISTDQLTYTFYLKPDLTWHDGEPLTVDDIIFTIQAAQNPLTRSNKRAAWDGVKVEKIDNLSVRLTLRQAYPAFLETATMGILPAHIWNKFDTDTFPLNQFNTNSVGSGPYQVAKINKDALGIPVYYDLAPFRHSALGEARISSLRLRFYPNETELVSAYQRGEIDAAASLSAENAAKLQASGTTVIRAPLPRVFGIFFNQNKAPVLANKEVRQALDLVVDRSAIIADVLKGYGLPAFGPLPQLATTTAMTDRNAAQALLSKNGWTRNDLDHIWEKKTKKTSVRLAFALATSDTPELKRAAELVARAWNAFGAEVTLKVFELGDLNQNVIRPRDYDALFFGEIIGRHPDLFAFWHSSQRLDPGLNIALYANIKADKLLENSRIENNPVKRDNLEKQFMAEMTADQPAVFIYQPEFLYLLPPALTGLKLPSINTAADRFLNIYQWYITTDKVWPIFVKNSK